MPPPLGEIMSDSYNSERDWRRSFRDRRARERERDSEHDAGMHEETEELIGSYSPIILADPKAQRRSNTSPRAEMMQRAQQTHGNRAIQRFLSVQRTSANTYVEEVTDDQLGNKIGKKSGSGDLLDEATRSRLEKELEENLSNVQVHTDAEADHLARAVKAPAFASGRNIFFQAGQFDPKSEDGMKLLAHQAIHTVQQSKGPVDGKPSDSGVIISDGSDTFEQEAQQKITEMEARQRSGSDGPAVDSAVQRNKMEEATPTIFNASSIAVQRKQVSW